MFVPRWANRCVMITCDRKIAR